MPIPGESHCRSWLYNVMLWTTASCLCAKLQRQLQQNSDDVNQHPSAFKNTIMSHSYQEGKQGEQTEASWRPDRHRWRRHDSLSLKRNQHSGVERPILVRCYCIDGDGSTPARRVLNQTRLHTSFRGRAYDTWREEEPELRGWEK